MAWLLCSRVREAFLSLPSHGAPLPPPWFLTTQFNLGQLPNLTIIVMRLYHWFFYTLKPALSNSDFANVPLPIQYCSIAPI